MNFLDLFAGNGCMARTAKSRGHNTFRVDWTNYPGTDLQIDIELLKISDIPFIPDHIHLSPDCKTYTIAAISTHRNGVEPKSEYAIKCDRVNKHVINLIKQWQIINPDLTFDFENPRGMLRKMPFMQEFTRHTVWYCKYGDDRAKPTDIWTNLKWQPRPVCWNGNGLCHHAPAPRGSKTGTQGRKGSFERSFIPEQLCLELIKCAELRIVETKIVGLQTDLFGKTA